MKKLLILGAGEAQLNLLEEANKLGYKTIVCDRRPNTTASKLADKYYQEDYLDQSTILKIAKEEQIDGVISNSEPAMSSVSFLVDQLNLPGNSSIALNNILSKEAFRALQKANGIFAPESYTSDQLEGILDRAKQMNFPLFIKPSESSGSRGAAKIDSYDTEVITKHFNNCQNFSRNNKVSIEEYIEMSSLMVYNSDIFVYNDEILWDGWYAGLRSSKHPSIPMAKILPTGLTRTQEEEFKNIVTKLVKAAKLSLGEFNVESYYDNKGRLFIIEINPRQAGDNIPKLINLHTGVNLTKLLVSLSVGDESYYNALKTYKRKNTPITMQVVFSEADGKYNGLEIDKNLKKFVIDIDEEYEKGEEIPRARNAEDSIATVTLQFSNIKEQKSFNQKLEQLIKAKLA